MSNNTILKKISIANNLKHFEIKEVFSLAEINLSSSQIKAYMAGSNHKNHEKLSDQYLEAFLNGLIIYARGSIDEPDLLPRMVENFIIDAVETSQDPIIEEIRCLLDDAQDELQGDNSQVGFEDDDEPL
ncbi:MAG: DUF1456 family protein [Zetaproteobacteria bacterium]|nr:DUF1456 family protein [Zetaproteobacteria bacterium]